MSCADPSADPVHVDAVHFDALAIVAMHEMLEANDVEVAFRLVCSLTPPDTTLRLTADPSGDRRGKPLDVAPCPPGDRPCVFAHTHLCRADRVCSPPSLNDLVSLVYDCVLGVTSAPVAVVAACERTGPHVYVYDCATAPDRQPTPMPAADVDRLAGAADAARRAGDDLAARALDAVVAALHRSGGRPFDLLHAPELAGPAAADGAAEGAAEGALRPPRPPKPPWVEYVVGAALVADSRAGFEIPDWLAPYAPANMVADRAGTTDGQLASTDEARRSADALRGWNIAIRRTRLPARGGALHVPL
jgi:hypothetical protein